MIILDTGGLYAALDANEQLHERAKAALASSRPPRVLSPFVLAELDYLIGLRVGHAAQLAMLGEVQSGIYQLEPFPAEDIERASAIMEKYESLRIGLADASVAVLALRYRTLDLLSTDQRHFRALRGTGGKHFRLLPYDARALNRSHCGVERSVRRALRSQAHRDRVRVIPSGSPRSPSRTALCT